MHHKEEEEEESHCKHKAEMRKVQAVAHHEELKAEAESHNEESKAFHKIMLF
jgi:hypothetical protein